MPTWTGHRMVNRRNATTAHFIVDGTEHYDKALSLHRAKTACGRWMTVENLTGHAGNRDAARDRRHADRGGLTDAFR